MQQHNTMRQVNTVMIGDRFRNQFGVIHEVKSYRPVVEGMVSMNDEFVLIRRTNNTEVTLVRDDLEELLVGWERLVPVGSGS